MSEYCINCEAVTKERDALKADLQEAYDDCIRLQQEINLLRMEPCQLPRCVALKARAERMKEALEEAVEVAQIAVNMHRRNKTVHHGDCTKECHTCEVCAATSHLRDMEAALLESALSEDGGSK